MHEKAKSKTHGKDSRVRRRWKTFTSAKLSSGKTSFPQVYVDTSPSDNRGNETQEIRYRSMKIMIYSEHHW